MGTAKGILVKITASLRYSSFSLGSSLLLFPLWPSIPFLPFTLSSAYFLLSPPLPSPFPNFTNNKNICKAAFIVHNLLKQFFKVLGGQKPKHRVDCQVWDACVCVLPCERAHSHGHVCVSWRASRPFHFSCVRGCESAALKEEEPANL